MAARRSTVVQIVPTSGTTFEFAAEGDLAARMEPTYNAAGLVTSVDWVWRVTDALIVTSDDTAEDLWDQFHALVAKLEAQSGNDLISTIRLQRHPDSDNVTEVDLTSGYEQLRVTEVEFGGPVDEAPGASWNAAIPVSFVISARKINANADGIVDVDQEVTHSYTNGLHTLTKTTILTTSEGTNAETKAKALCGIDIADWGSSYAYQTNSEWGINWEVLDGDDVSDATPRVPTLVRAVSSIQRYYVDVGTTAAGQSPDSIDYVVSTRTTRDEIRRTITAKASGPGAKAWVEAKRPAGKISEEQIDDGQATGEVTATWIRVTPRSGQTTAVDATLIKVEISGGGRIQEWGVNAGGRPPIQFRGGYTWQQAVVTIRVAWRGDQLVARDLMFPGKLPSPWVLDLNESTETDPFLDEQGSDSTADKWAREARLVYRSPTRFTRSPIELIREADPVVSYLDRVRS